MEINLNYLMEHVSHQLHTFVKTWSGSAGSAIQPRTVCVRRDLQDNYLPFSDFLAFLEKQKAEDFSSCPLLFSVRWVSLDLAYGYVVSGEQHFLIGPVLLSNETHLSTRITAASDSLSGPEKLFSCHLYFFL